jgi:hypothetical protein
VTSSRPSETPDERADRQLGELLQELRVAQAGVQILFAFLLVLPFQGGFADLSTTLTNVYAFSLLSALVAAALMIAPVALHRILFRQHMKEKVIVSAHRMASVGLLFLAMSMTGSVFLALDVSIGRPFSLVAGVCSAGLFIGLWLVWPSRLRSDDSS